MPRSLAHRWLLVYLGVFALIGQLMLPTVHAQNLAQRSGNPLYAAFCGEVAPQRLAVLRQQLAVSPQQADTDVSQSQHPLKAGCPICASLHAAQLAVSPVIELPLLLRSSIVVLPLAAVATVIPRATRPPPSQGPPQSS
ncbi:DUF2946 family protein [Solimonas terrae]|uniref:DUF2946 family protein n=1 Tax=Solimonas terrae TaxID=1396819 RepID=A0A6M2BTW6_9GAMM|nr:DUF2946 family protein [Solimonas terrae]NGY05553.1 DUF2946 family protein [Solimonas terrae]